MVAVGPLQTGTRIDPRTEQVGSKRSFRPQCRPSRSQKKALDQAETEFERLVEKGDDGAVMEQVGRVETARAELNKSRTHDAAPDEAGADDRSVGQIYRPASGRRA